MDISPPGRRLIFGLIVCVLVALGAYLLGPVARGVGRSSPQRSPTPRASRPAATASGPASTPADGQPDIYQWLPFTQAGLAAAASVVGPVRRRLWQLLLHAERHRLYRPARADHRPAAGRPDRSRGLLGARRRGGARAASKQVAVGTAMIASIRAFGPSSLTFLIQVAQQLTDTAARQSADHGLRRHCHRFRHKLAGNLTSSCSRQVIRDRRAGPLDLAAAGRLATGAARAAAWSSLSCARRRCC